MTKILQQVRKLLVDFLLDVLGQLFVLLVSSFVELNLHG